MMEITGQRFFFKYKEIWFAESPYRVSGFDSVRFRACRSKADAKGFRCEEQATLVIDLTRDLDAIWKDMDAESCRRRIKRGYKQGVRVRFCNKYEDYLRLYELNKAFRKRKGLRYTMGAEEMRKYGPLVLTEVDGETVSGDLYVQDQYNIRWLIGASKRLEVDELKKSLIGCANRVAIWEAIQYAKSNGKREFDMGGYYTGGKPDDPRHTINLYKQSFGGKLVTYYSYDWETKLYKLASWIQDFFVQTKIF
jgi:hypothetical protein